MAVLKSTYSRPRVALDDGHGMQTSGKRSPILPDGLRSETGVFMHENEFNRAVVKLLRIELIRCGFDVVETAPGDGDTPLSTRSKTANNFNADLLISVHANANTGKWGTANGVEVLSFAKHKTVANVFLNHLMKGSPQKNRGWKDGSWLGLLCGLKSSVTGVLVECAFMDNLQEAKLLLSDAFRLECAIELAQATCELFGKKYIAAGTSTAPAATTSAYPYDKSKGIGTLKVLVDSLNVRESASFNSKLLSVVKKDEVYYVYEQQNGLYNVGNGWVSAGAAYVAFTAHPATDRKKHVVVKGDTLWAIATKNGTSVSKLESLNPGLTSDINPGDVIYLS